MRNLTEKSSEKSNKKKSDEFDVNRFDNPTKRDARPDGQTGRAAESGGPFGIRITDSATGITNSPNRGYSMIR